jgi:hypothetical protein
MPATVDHPHLRLVPPASIGPDADDADERADRIARALSAAIREIDPTDAASRHAILAIFDAYLASLRALGLEGRPA